MKNRFFNIALNSAASIAGKRGRVLLLVTQLGIKLKDSDWKSINGSVLKSKFSTIGRLIKAYASGNYRTISWKAMITITAAVIYFINPFDLLPDVIPITGLTDDLGVLLWVYNSASGEMQKFLTWEKSQTAQV